MMWRHCISAVLLLLCQPRTLGASTWDSKADVVFVLDGSDAVSPAQWDSMRSMLVSLVQQWNIGPNNIQVGAVSYGGGAHSQFFVDEATSGADLVHRLQTLTLSGGTADAAQAVHLASTTSLSAAHGARDGVPHILVHVTAGPSADPSKLRLEVQEARNHGDTIFTVGVGEGVTFDHLAKVSSDPVARYVLQADTATALNNLVPALAARVANEIPVSANTLPPANSCLQKADLALVIDSSSSVGQQDFEYLEDFVKALVTQLPVGQDQVHVGAVQFSGHPRLAFPLTAYTDRLSLLRAVEDLRYMGGGTNTADALNYLASDLFTTQAGARTDVPRVAIVVTDGQSVEGAKTFQAAEGVRDNDIALMAIGVGGNVNGDELRHIANSPDNDNVFKVANYRDLRNLTTDILNAACKLHSMITPTPTGPPGAATTGEPCRDAIADCHAYDERSCGVYTEWAQQNCRKTCGLCHTAEQLSCENKVQHCDTYGPSVCTSDVRKQWAHENCQRFCGFCDPSATKLGFYGKCMYKGVEYAQSERWEDGCDYECVCEDAREGRYRCYNRCPVYHDLPAQCTLVASPDGCCLKPVCDFNQHVTISKVAPGPSYNAQNMAVCEYQGKQYFQDQTWEVGCDLKCICTNASQGAYQCQSFCPDYPPLPSECRLVQKPGRCCREPVCEFNTQTGSFTGFGTLSGRGIDTTPQKPVCEDVVSDCEAHGPTVCTDYPAWAKANCAKSCSLCTADPKVPGPNDVCYYNGEKHGEGETWRISCDTECVCEDAVYGYYRCYKTCPSYLNLPSGCRTVRKAGECCLVAECEYGTYYPSSSNVLSLGNGGGIRVRDPSGQLMEVYPTLPSGSTLPPGTFGGSMDLSSITLDGCLFNGEMYVQSQQWHDGCDHTCTCLDAATGHFTCRERCPTYSNASSSCPTERDPSDACCLRPACPPSSGIVPVPAFGRSVQSVGRVVAPSPSRLASGAVTAQFTLLYSGLTVPPPTGPHVSLQPGGLDYCEYHGRRYSHGETWEDGCDYNCVCVDASTGSWRCVEKCEKYVDIPQPYCHLEQDPTNTCCQRPVCNFVVGHVQIEGTNTIPTTPASTTPGYSEPRCVYKGVDYALGQAWYDGCSFLCRCDDADNNQVTCISRCQSYPPDYDGCDQQPDPRDPTCCLVPVCSPTAAPVPTPYPGAVPVRVPPRVPVIPPGIVTGGNSTGFCLYKGDKFSQGDTWDDGCDYNCVCKDAQNGVYQCTEKCQRFGVLPSSCRLVTDYTNPCCQTPVCSGTNTNINGSSVAPTGPTPSTAAVCVYNGVRFQQDQEWQEGCTKVCRCQDADNGLYTCTDRCPKYDSLPAECTLISDPDDPCCLTPKCVPGFLSGTTLAPIPGQIPTLVPGRIVGNAIYPTPTPGPNGETPGINFCMYDGVPYAQGAAWQDGCKFDCACVNASSGRYECRERCARYAAVPAGCVMVRDADDPCCQRPVCSPGLVTPTPAPLLTPLPGSTAVPVVGPSPGPTPGPQATCVYKQVSYSQGQSWYDGCDYSCTCEDAEKGVYRCIERCPTYDSLPAECSLGPDPRDPLCCQRPLCQFVPPLNQTTGYLVPPLRPGTVSGGSVTPSPRPYVTPTPGPDGSTLTPPRSTPEPKKVCVYDGQEYGQGQKWADGCDYDCQCVDAATGRYQCTEKCLLWSSIPPQCTLVADPNKPCCQLPYCDTNRPTPSPLPTAAPSPGVTHAPFIGPDGSTLAPPTVQTPAPPKDRCLYNGVPYMTGDTWDDGCDQKCVCEDGPANVYRCDQRCSVFDLPAGCQLVTDPRDSCCQVPFCDPVLPTPGPTPGPNAGPNVPPFLVPTAVPGTQIGVVNRPNINPNSSETVGCVFNGVTYRRGDSWDDGCTRKCVCLNGTAGVYQCTDRCNRYLNVPSNCQLVVDPADACCKTPLCRPDSAPTPGPNATPVLGQSTAVPGTGTTLVPTPSGRSTLVPKKACVYKGQTYLDGQQWYDGCDKVCVCDDADSNFYSCSDRCPTYDNVPAECQLVASPSDPACCQVPQCLPTPGPQGYPTPGPNVSPTPTVFTNPPGVVTGLAPTPSPRPGYPTPGYRNACVYKGREYSQGQEWQDGCDYNCKCLNASTGYYKCQERCSVFAVVPSQCQLVPDPMDFCCRQLQCDFRQPTPNPFSPFPEPSRLPDPNLHSTLAPPLATGSTQAPPTYVPPTVAPQYTSCVYKGIAYRQGESWNIGCDQKCTCDDSTQNYYTCADRCASYGALPPGCQLTVDPKDACCQVPRCYVIPTPAPGATPNLPPGQSTPPPLPIPTGVPGVIIGSPNTGTSTDQKGCVRNNVLYSPGDTWQDGCQYNCECLDTTGRYKCTERCPPYPQIPDYCVMSASATDSCCSEPLCPNPYQPTPAPGSTLSPPPGVSTPSPGPGGVPVPTTPLYPLPKGTGQGCKKICFQNHRPCGFSVVCSPTPVSPQRHDKEPGYSANSVDDVCVYKGSAYTEGQRWYDGCDKACVCENGKTGFYRCSDRCSIYAGLPADCKLVPDLQDPACCVVPQCDTQDPLNVTGHVGTITGSGKPPTPSPLATLSPPTAGPGAFLTPQPPADICVYNGRSYIQGQVWLDSCSYSCECFNASQGQYRCTDRCPRYPQNVASFCTMARDPADPCCMKPDCNVAPTLPSGSTPAPAIARIPFPTLHPTLVPGREFCVYKGIPYTHGQTWNDGCDKTCRCEDVVTGQVNCDDRCASYDQIQPGCQLVTDPRDPCCRVPQCPALPDSTNTTIVVPGTTGTITGSSLPPNNRGPLTRSNVCIYHGRTYQQGDLWDDGCTYVCECIDSMQGKYVCKERCQRFVNLPPTCTMARAPNDECCQVPYCSPFPAPAPTPAPDVSPTPGGQQPSALPTIAPAVTPATSACVYQGQMYRQGQQWYDGCSLVCRCEDANTGFYRCQERCAHYSADPECVLVPDPQNPTCCQIPQCPLATPTPLPGASPTPGIVDVTVAPGRVVGYGRVPTPMSTLAPTLVTRPDGSIVVPTPGRVSGCLYQGVTYQEGQTWEDGCQYVCQCLNGTTGKYSCSEKCPILPQLPSDRCVLVQDPKEPCCMAPFCDFTNPTPFPNGTPTPYPKQQPTPRSTLVPGTGPTHTPLATPTPAPYGVPDGFCVYHGVYYRQGEDWSDGCDLQCTCDNATIGFYSCKERCKTFGQLADGCVLLADPSDACCLVPQCPAIAVTARPLPGVTGSATPAPTYILTGVQKGSFTGHGNVGQPTGNYGSNTGFSNGCVYKGTAYQQNAVWDDGCDYQCVCTDGLRGQYQCTDRCTSYYFLPPVCVLEADPADTCCQRARCTPPQPTTPVTPTPSSPVGVSGGVSGFTGTGPAISVTPVTGPGISGNRTTAMVGGSTPPGFTGTGPAINITPVTGPGISGNGTTAMVGGSTPPGFTGTGPAINITPVTGPGISGNGTTAMVGGSTPPGFSGSRALCLYKGVPYHKGDSWDDGCDLHCTCDDDVQGLYSCTYRCPAYSSLPRFCHLQSDGRDACCKQPVCTVSGTQLVPQLGGSPTQSPTLDPSVTNVIPLGTHSIISGSSRPPGQGTQTIYGGRSSCIYKGVEYIPGQSWDDGCQYTCTCLGEDAGLYRCASKCPSYPALPAYCSMVSVPGLCCPSLACDVPHVGPYSPYPQVEPGAKPTPAPDGTFPTPEPTVDPQLILGGGVGVTGGTGLPGGGHAVPGGYVHNLGGITDKCIYDLKMYNQGESWNLGCNYTCSCLDSRTGFYKCKERCAVYDPSTLPQVCQMVADPSDSCCQTPSCPDPAHPGQTITNITQIQQLYPIVGSYVGGTSGFRPGYIPTGNRGTIGGTRDGCVYKNKLYPEGGSWEDGCDFDCRCIDGKTGVFQCTAKCTTYAALPPMCSLQEVEGQCCPTIHCDAVTTPHDGTCRDKIDNCYQYRKSACSGAYEAWARDHCPLFCGFCTPDVTTTPPPCEDSIPNCKNYGQDVCTNVAYADWAQSHCRKFCNLCGTTIPTTTIWTTPASGCFDAVSYCDVYGTNVCSDPMYKAWVLDNCQKYCGICGNDTLASTTPEPCADRLDTCALYGRGSCGGEYFGWARHNCRKFCDLCNVTTQTPGSTPPSTTPPSCQDRLDNCKDYPDVYCKGDYLAWAKDNCPAHCGLCDYELTTVAVVTPEPGWLLLLKGVSGVPGDLWHLWSTPATMNELVPQAQYLTDQFKGHYKPAIANQWDVCHFETVKVEILDKGVEKANIIFDVHNSGKNDWFRPENFVSSTFTDLPTASTAFNMPRDSGTGQEFAIGTFGDCDGSGWMFVTTNTSCSFQNNGQQPQFFYSLTDTVAQLAPNKVGSGDVFAILGKGGNCMSGVLTTYSAFTGVKAGCFYKGQVYGEGDVWQDGCDYNCTCLDASSGQYLCTDQCLTYNNMPQECSLTQKPGECCPTLSCPYPTGDGCYYKNQTYPQGATWQDDCLYDCTCDNGHDGIYNCVSICQDWSNLPSVCHMESPDPGKCCPRPVCPAPMVVDFTPR